MRLNTKQMYIFIPAFFSPQNACVDSKNSQLEMAQVMPLDNGSILISAYKNLE